MVRSYMHTLHPVLKIGNKPSPLVEVEMDRTTDETDKIVEE